MNRILQAVCACLCGFSLVGAQELQFRTSVNPSEIRIGDRFQYHLEVESPESLQVDLPELVGNLGSFEVKDLLSGEKKLGQGKVLYTWDLTLSTFIGGDFVIPPQTVIAIAGKDTLRTQTEPVRVRVLGRVSEADEDILDLEDPISDPHWAWWVWALIAVGATVILALIGRLFWKKLRRPAAPPPLAPYEEALSSLSALRARKLLESGEQAAHFYELGQLMRRFLHREYHADLLDATTHEMEERLNGISALPAELRHRWLDFCRESDMVKFAQQSLEQERAHMWDSFIDELLQTLKPQPMETK